MTKKTDDLLSSNYDGIQEYDNDLPRWWIMLFYGTIIFAVLYSCYYYLGFTPGSEEKLTAQLQEIEKLKPAAPKEISEDTLLAFAKDPNHISKGKAIFDSKCNVCHGNEGQGLVGPNLTDEFWIHGAKLTEMKKIIEHGVLEKGMLAWKGVITDEEITDVVVFINSIKGTNPANPKAPEGAKING